MLNLKKILKEDKQKAVQESHRDRIVLVGAAGWPNYGDEIILDAWLTYYEKALEDYSVDVFEGTKKSAERIHRRHSKKNNITFSNALEKVAHSYEAGGFWNQVLRGYDFVDNNGEKKYAHIDLSAVRRASKIHLHGGGYLNDFWPQRGFIVGYLAKIAEITGAKLCATGIGFGPVKDPEENSIPKLTKVFKNFEFFELRDVEGFRYLTKTFGSLGFFWGLDDCYIKPIKEVAQPGEGKRLYLSFLKNSIYKVSNDYWLNLIDFSQKFDDVIFFESSPDQDKEVFEFLKNKIPRLQLLSVYDAISSGFMVGPDDQVIASRFHVHYMLARAGARGQYSSHNQDQRYYDVKHQSIIDRGSPFAKSDFAKVEHAAQGRKSIIAMLESVHSVQKKYLADGFYI